MAFGSEGWYLVVNLVDSGNNQFSKRYQLEAADAAAAAAAVATVITNLQAVTDLPIVSYHYYELQVEQALTLPLNVQGENKALLTMRIDGKPHKSATDTIPGAKSTVFVSATGDNANIVNTEHASVASYWQMFMAGQQLFISDGEKVDQIKGGRRIHSKSNRG